MKTPLRELVAKRIKAARLHRLWRSSDVIRHTKISPQSLCDYENGRRTPTLERLVVIAKSLNISSDFLLGLTDSFVSTPKTDEINELFQALSEDDKKLAEKILRVVVKHKLVRRSKLKAHETTPP